MSSQLCTSTPYPVFQHLPDLYVGHDTCKCLQHANILPGCAGSQSPASRGLQSLTAAAAPAPGAAVGADMAVDAAHVLYVYGGAPQSGPMHGDLWALNTGTWTWQELKPQGAVPEVRGVCWAVLRRGRKAVAQLTPQSVVTYAAASPYDSLHRFPWHAVDALFQRLLLPCFCCCCCFAAAPRTLAQERCSHVAGAAGPGGRYLLVIGGARYEAAGLVPRDDVILYDTQVCIRTTWALYL